MDMITQIGFGADVGQNYHSGKHISVSATSIRMALTEANRLAPNEYVYQITYCAEVVWDASNGLLNNRWFDSLDECPKSDLT